MKYIVLNSFHIHLFAPHIKHADHLAQVAGPNDRCTGAGFVSKGLEVLRRVGRSGGRRRTDGQYTTQHSSTKGA